jgi:hypothetical protein
MGRNEKERKGRRERKDGKDGKDGRNGDGRDKKRSFVGWAMNASGASGFEKGADPSGGKRVSGGAEMEVEMCLEVHGSDKEWGSGDVQARRTFIRSGASGKFAA